MKSKIKKVSGTLLASLACLTVGSIGSISPVYALCENAPKAGSQFKYAGPGEFKLRTTFQTFVSTKNPKLLNKYLTRADRRAQFDLGEFFKGVFNGEIDLNSKGEAEWLIGPEDMVQEEITKGFEEEKENYNTKVKNFAIPGSRRIASCIDPGNQIIVTREISSETIFAAIQGLDASNLLNDNDNSSDEKGESNDEVAANETIVSEENKGPKGYKSQVSGGYDGYADMDEF